jgi:hypothetical protein
VQPCWPLSCCLRPWAKRRCRPPASFAILGVQESSRGNATVSLYIRPGRGDVFNAATTTRTRGLSAANNPHGYQMVQRITRNVIDTLPVTTTTTQALPRWPP